MDAGGFKQEKMTSIYEYPEYYEIVFGKRQIAKQVSFLDKIFRKFSNVKTVLDIACGRGPHLISLIRKGYECDGLDISWRMMQPLKEDLDKMKLYAEMYQQDMTNININKKYDACICMVNSIQILLTNKDLVNHFRSVAKILKKGGIYVVEMDHPKEFACFFSNNQKKFYVKEFEKDDVKIKVTFEKLGFDLEKGIEKNNLIFEVNDNGKKIKLVDDSPIRRIMPQEFLALAGDEFELVKFYGDFELNVSLNDENASRMIAVLRKKSNS